MAYAHPPQAIPQIVLPPPVAENAMAQQLGQPLGMYSVRHTRMAIISAVSGSILAAFMAFVGYMAFMQENSSSDTTLTMLLMVLLVLLGMGTGLYGLFFPQIYRSFRCFLFSDGFIYTHWNKLDVCRWDQIDHMKEFVGEQRTHGISLGTFHKYTIERKDGAKIVFRDHFADVEQISIHITEGLNRVLLPHMIAAIDAGQIVGFGPLGVSRQGIHKGENVLPWHEFFDIEVGTGLLTMEVKIQKMNGILPWAAVPMKKMPNLSLFHIVVRHVWRMTGNARY